MADKSADFPQVIELSTVGSIYIINVQGPVTYDRGIRLMRFLTAIAEETGSTQFLIDFCQAPYQGTITSLYDLAYGGLEMLGYRRYWKTAIITLPENELHHFFETAAENAGYTIQSFVNRSRAMNWLQ